MRFTPTSLAGAVIIDAEPYTDFRGVFARTWSCAEFAAHGLDTEVLESSASLNYRRGTLRGMHFQVAPFQEVKLVRCTRGAIYDVIIDLRPESSTYLQHLGVELSAQNRRALYMAAGFAHGFQTLEDDTEVAYQMNQKYSPEHARGVRWNDPVFGIEWPLANPILLERDATYPDFASTVLA